MHEYIASHIRAIIYIHAAKREPKQLAQCGKTFAKPRPLVSSFLCSCRKCLNHRAPNNNHLQNRSSEMRISGVTLTAHRLRFGRDKVEKRDEAPWSECGDEKLHISAQHATALERRVLLMQETAIVCVLGSGLMEIDWFR